MGWNRVKKLFKKKRQRDEVITYDGGHIGLKDLGAPDLSDMEVGESIPSNMGIHVKLIGPKAGSDLNRYEVNGVMFDAKSASEAQRKYLRQQHEVSQW